MAKTALCIASYADALSIISIHLYFKREPIETATQKTIKKSKSKKVKASVARLNKIPRNSRLLLVSIAKIDNH